MTVKETKVCAAKGCRKKVEGRKKYCSNACKMKVSRKKTKKTVAKSKRTCSKCPTPINYKNKSGLCKSCKSLERIEYRKANLHLCAISRWLIEKVKRHTTVECLPSDERGMKELLSLRAYQFKANGLYFDDDWEVDFSKNRFEICHRFPCKHRDGRIGLYVRENLVLAPKHLNRSYSNALVCENGLYLERDKLKPHLRVGKLTSDEQIFNLIKEWCPYIVDHLMEKTPSGAYRYSLTRSKSKPKKQPKNLEGLSEQEVFEAESYQSFGYVDNSCFSNKYTCVEFAFALDFLELEHLEVGFEHLLTTPALDYETRKQNAGTVSEVEFLPLELEPVEYDEIEEIIPF